jgi:hypothetical protein
MAVGNAATVVDALEDYLQFVANNCLPTAGHYEAVRLCDATNGKYQELRTKQTALVRSLKSMADHGDDRTKLDAYQLVAGLCDLITTCSQATVWQSDDQRIHALGYLLLDLYSWFVPWDTFKCTPMPGAIAQSGVPQLLPDLAAGIMHRCLQLMRSQRPPTGGDPVAGIKQALGAILEHIHPGVASPSRAANIIQDILNNLIPAAKPPWHSEGEPTPAKPTPEDRYRVSDGLNWWSCAKLQGPIWETVASILEDRLKNDPKRDYFKGWPGLIFAYDLAWPDNKEQKQGSGHDVTYDLAAWIDKKLKLRSHWHENAADCDKARGDILKNVSDPHPGSDPNGTPQDGFHKLSQDMYWRVHRTGGNPFQGARDWSNDPAAAQPPTGRYTLPLEEDAASLYLGMTAECALREMFADKLVLDLPSVDRSLSLINWSGAKAARILDIDVIAKRAGVADQLEYMTWGQTAPIAIEAHQEGFHGMIYKSVKVTTDRNVVLFTRGATPTVPGVFAIERTQQLFASTEFWTYVKARACEGALTFLGRMPDDVRLKKVASAT